MTEQNIFTIGFTQKSAEKFFELLTKNSVKRLVDTRLNNTGQLAGFSKKEDLMYFCRKIANIEYIHWEESAPEDAMLSAYKKKQIAWDEYEKEYMALLQRRRIESSIEIISSTTSCLLCSEAKPHLCHRRLLADYLNKSAGGSFTVRHLT